MTPRMPSLYIPHGAGPCFFMDWSPPDAWDRTADFLRGVLAALPRRPRAVVLVSAHWEAASFTVQTADSPGLLFDYSGFPPHTYDLRYPASGDAALAERIRELLAAAGLSHAGDDARPFDHGMFVPMMLIAPAADIPVVQLSLRAGLAAGEHHAAGRALEALREDDIFIVGSGMSYHNMRGYGRVESGPVSERFDAWLAETVGCVDVEERGARLATWDRQPDGRSSHPREEHLIPLMVVSGAGGGGAGRRVFSDRVMSTTISAFRFD